MSYSKHKERYQSDYRQYKKDLKPRLGWRFVFRQEEFSMDDAFIKNVLYHQVSFQSSTGTMSHYVTFVVFTYLNQVVEMRQHDGLINRFRKMHKATGEPLEVIKRFLEL